MLTGPDTGISTWRPLAILGGFVAACTLATTTVAIAPGDTLSEIAREHGVSVADLVAWNDLDDPDRIIAGATLLVADPDDGGGGDRDGETGGGAVGDTYTIAPGDTLSTIAVRFGVSVARLVRANGLDDPDRIIAGSTLRLDDTADTSEPPTAPGLTTDGYTVVAGDTLSTIAANLGVPISSLVQANGLTNPDRIYAGQVLHVTAPRAPTPTPTPTTTTTPPPAPSPAPDPAPTPAPPPLPDPGPGTGSPSDEPLSTLFARWSEAYAVPRDLLEALLWKESDWRPAAVGPAGHLGIGQLSPATVEFVETRLLGRDMDPLDADDGIQMAARFLRYLLDRTDTEREALAAWNQGLGAVQDHGVSGTGGAFADSVLEIRRQRA